VTSTDELLDAVVAPWDWSRLTAPEVDEAWRELAIWVEFLRGEYRPWVRLPDCWPLHEALRSELLLFMHWQQRIVHLGQDPEEGVRWHSELRRAAEAWACLATCVHGARERGPAAAEERRRLVLAANLGQAVRSWQARLA
jgi:hypothetical protein